MLGDLEFLAVDTSGLEVVMRDGIRNSRSSSLNSISMRATELTEGVVQRSDVILFLMDGKDGVVAVDRDLARWFRRRGVVDRVVPVMNKCDGRRHRGYGYGSGGGGAAGDAEVEVGKLGFRSVDGGSYVGVSAETGEGMADLYEAIRPRLDDLTRERMASLSYLSHLGEVSDAVKSDASKDGSEGGASQHKGHPKVAIMGLTNVGKSTLLNRLVGRERCVTGPEPGLTRDAITVELRGRDGAVVAELVDTAGWIRRTRLKAHDDSDGAVAEMTMREGKTVMRFVHVVMLVVDCERVAERMRLDARLGALGSTRTREGVEDVVLTHAEAALVADAVAQGRAVVVGLNKVDLLLEDSFSGKSTPTSRDVRESRAVEAIRESLRRVTPELGDSATILPISATHGSGIDEIIPAIQNVYGKWNARMPTGKLNAWLRELKLEKAHVGGGNTVSRIKYLSQVKSRPPTFVVFVSGKSKLGDSVGRFLANRLRDDFDLHGVPVRVIQRNTK